MSARLRRHLFIAPVLLPPLVFILLYRLAFDTPANGKRESGVKCGGAMPIHVLPVRRLGQNGRMTGQARSRKLMAMAERCQRGPASRELDGAVCCVLHDVEDGNSLSNALLRISRQNGEVLIEKPGAWPLGWFAAPAFTSDTEAARALYPSSPASLPADPLEACAAGLRARAAAAALGNELPAPLIPRYRH